jgi:Domain of unknown function (DUF4419)
MQMFKVSDVEERSVSGEAAPAAEVVGAFRNRVEAVRSNRPELKRMTGKNAFFATIHRAFAEHHALALSPDDVWLAIAQGFAIHMERHGEALRGRFVRHEGKLTLDVRRDDLVKGSPDNPWDKVVSQMCVQIRDHIGKKVDLVVADFSTTGAIEKAASEVVLLGAMRPFFDYTVATLCGIPRVALLGTPSDWASIRRRAAALSEYDLAWWTDALLPVLDEIVRSAGGDVDPAFWRSIYKLNDESGGPFITGWVNVLFPYVRALHFADKTATVERNPHLAWRNAPRFEGLRSDALLPGQTPVPFRWTYLGVPLSMEIVAGFLGLAHDRDLGALRPAIGWAVSEVDPGAGQGVR